MRQEHLRPKLRKPSRAPMGVGACLGGVLLAGFPAMLARAQSSPGDAKLDRLEKENQELRQRLDALEGVAKKEGILPSGGDTHTVKALSEITLSGFATASYFYDTSKPANNSPNGYLWNRKENSFSINKVKLTLASPAVERSGDKWDAGYRASFIFGEDAPIVNTGNYSQIVSTPGGGTARVRSASSAGFEDLREAYVEMNAPVGTGLNVKVGELISLLNFESGDGGAVNPNFSQGYQWFYTGNGPAAGAQVGYAFSDVVDAKVRVQNGLYTGPVDNNGFKTLVGSLGIKPDSKTSLNLIGFGGREGPESGLWLKGGSLIANRQLAETYNVNFATEFDYFSLDEVKAKADWWSIGGWLWSDFTPKFGAALRADYISDNNGAATSGLLGFPVNPGQDLYSLTFTLNIRPVPNLKIQPEVRYDHTSLKGGFGDKRDRVIVGAGASYLF